MSQSKVSKKVDDLAKQVSDKEIKDSLHLLAEPLGGVELGYVCQECGVLLEDDEVESGSLAECTNCGCPFYEI